MERAITELYSDQFGLLPPKRRAWVEATMQRLDGTGIFGGGR